MVVIDHMQLIQHDNTKITNITLFDGRIDERIRLLYIRTSHKFRLSHDPAFSIVQTAMSTSAQSVRAVLPPKYPTTLIDW